MSGKKSTAQNSCASRSKVHCENMPVVKIKSPKKAPAVPPAYSSNILKEDEIPARSKQGFFDAFGKFTELCGLDESLLIANDDLPLGYEIVLPNSEYRAAMEDAEEWLDGLMILAFLSGQEIEEPIDAAVIRRVLLDSPLTDSAMRLISEANGLK